MGEEMWTDITEQLGTISVGNVNEFLKSLCQRVGRTVADAGLEEDGVYLEEEQVEDLTDNVWCAIFASLGEHPKIEECCDVKELEKIYFGRK